MDTVECKTLTANVVLGLQRGYGEEIISKRKVKDVINNIQHEIKNQFGVLLSVKVTPCEIICFGQEEPSITLEFIQYPKFLCEEKQWNNGVIEFAKKAMSELEQNRTIIVFQDKTIMLENSNEIDPKINLA
jgi:hypothetical protein